MSMSHDMYLYQGLHEHQVHINQPTEGPAKPTACTKNGHARRLEMG